MSFAKAIARAWSDPTYKAELIRDPKSAFAKIGITVPESQNAQVAEEANEALGNRDKLRKR